MGFISKIFFLRGGLGLDIFFVLSGFVISISASKNTGKPFRFLTSRFLRVFPNYWLYTLLLVASCALLPAWCYVTQWTPRSLLLSLFLIPNENPNHYGQYPFLYTGWSLSYEMFFYTGMGLLLAAFRRWALVATMIVFALLPAVFGKLDLHPLGHSNAILLEFALGIAIYFIHDRWLSKLPTSRQLLISVPSMAIVVALLCSGEFRSGFRLALGFVTILSVLTLEPLVRRGGLATRLLAKLGDTSYSVYLSHVVVLGWTLAIFGIPRNDPMEAVILVPFLAMNIAISLVTFAHVETGAFAKRLKSLVARATPAGWL